MHLTQVQIIMLLLIFVFYSKERMEVFLPEEIFNLKEFNSFIFFNLLPVIGTSFLSM